MFLGGVEIDMWHKMGYFHIISIVNIANINIIVKMGWQPKIIIFHIPHTQSTSVNPLSASVALIQKPGYWMVSIWG